MFFFAGEALHWKMPDFSAKKNTHEWSFQLYRWYEWKLYNPSSCWLTSFIPWFLFHGAFCDWTSWIFFCSQAQSGQNGKWLGRKRASLGCYRHSSTQCKANLEPVLQLKNKGKGLLELDFEKCFTVKDRLIIAQWQWAWCKCNIVEEPAYDLQGLCQFWICYVFIRF